MISYKDKPDNQENVKELLHPAVKQWFFSKFKEFSLPQLYGVLEVHSRNNILISAPTGSGKTLSSLLAILNELIDSSYKGILKDKVYCIYISPLKALNRDIHLNLIEPLEEIEKIAEKKFGIRVSVRTGDTTQAEKAKMLNKPPHILVTTPESLAILLSSIKFKEHIKEVDYCIIDEIHSLAENKRGVHLSLSLEKLQNLSTGMCRIGLSATIAPLDEIAKFLVGDERDCKIIDARFDKKLDIEVISPVDDLINTTYNKINSEMYKLIDKLIHEHKTTLIFTNTRSATERVVHHLKTHFPKKYTEIIKDEPLEMASLIGAHHGSLSKEHRFAMEEALRKGKLKAVVCLEGNTKILNSCGEWVKIKDIKEDYVQSMDNKMKLNNNKIITKITKANSESLIKLKTRLGKEITCTKEHKFLTIEQGKLHWKEAKDLKDEDFIATIRNYNYKNYSEKEIKELTFDSYPEDKFVELNNDFLKILKSEILKNFCFIKYFWAEKLNNNCKYDDIKNYLAGNGLFKISILKKVAENLNIEKSIIFDNIIHISSDKNKDKKIIISEKFMRLLGFMTAEGYISDHGLFVTNRNKKLLEYYDNIIYELAGKKAFRKIGSTGTPILVWYSVFLSKFLRSLGFKIGRKARIANIPNFIFRLNSRLVSSFISGYIDGDGFIEIKKSKDNRVYAVGFSTTSKEMTEDICRILIRESICSSIRSRYEDSEQKMDDGRIIKKKGWFYDVAILGGEHIRKFAEFIDPIRENILRINELENLDGYCHRDIIPNIGSIIRKIREYRGISNYRLRKEGKTDTTRYELGNRNITRSKLLEIIKELNIKDSFIKDLPESDLLWEKLKSKEIVKATEFVYNIEVENDHNYIANEFITKNCSTSLELGIDIGYIDLVICLGSPKSIARLSQRTGRSGHRLHEIIKGKIIVLDQDDLVECSVMVKNMIERKIDRIHIPKNCLDVLAQQVFGAAIEQVWDIDELYNLVKKSYCYNTLSRKDFDDIISYLAGEFASLEDRHVYAKIWKNENKIGKKGKLSRVIYMTNIGTIPDESFITVKVQDHPIGHIDENFLEKLKPGDIFVLGGNTYEFKFSRGMVAQVKSAEGRKPTIPSWFSEMLPLSFDLALEIQKFRKLMLDKFENKKSKEEILKFIRKYLYINEKAADAIYNYFNDQYKFLDIPNHSKLIIENYIDEEEKHYIVFHSLFGRRVNDVLSRAVAFAVGRNQHRDVEVGISDNGFYISFEGKVNVMQAFKLIKSNELKDLMNIAIEKSEVLKRRFRHCASRSLMILRIYKGQRKRVGRQQVSSMLLISAVKRISNDFCILKEARREVLEDLMDLNNAVEIIKFIEDGKIKIKEMTTRIPSPFALNLVLQGYSDILKIEEKHEFLQRMHELIKLKIKMKG